MATDTQQRFVVRALRRKKLFLALSIVGIVIAVVLAAYYGFRRFNDPTFPIGSHAVIILLILLNSRQNLRQYRFASFIEDCQRRPSDRDVKRGADPGPSPPRSGFSQASP